MSCSQSTKFCSISQCSVLMKITPFFSHLPIWTDCAFIIITLNGFNNLKKSLTHKPTVEVVPLDRCYGHSFIHSESVQQSFVMYPELTYLYNAFGRHHSERLYNLSKRTDNPNTDRFARTALAEIKQKWKLCQIYAQTPRRLKFSLCGDKALNETIFYQNVFYSHKPHLTCRRWNHTIPSCQIVSKYKSTVSMAVNASLLDRHLSRSTVHWGAWCRQTICRSKFSNKHKTSIHRNIVRPKWNTKPNRPRRTLPHAYQAHLQSRENRSTGRWRRGSTPGGEKRQWLYQIPQLSAESTCIQSTPMSQLSKSQTYAIDISTSRCSI